MTMPRCLHQPELSDYLDGSLDPERADAVRRHLEADPPCGCRRELEEMKEMVASLGRLQPGSAPGGGWERLEDALERDAVRSRGGWRLAGLAASVLVVVGGLVALMALDVGGGPVEVAGAPGTETPKLLKAAAGVERPPVTIPEEMLVRYAAEIEPIDRLIAALHEMPDDYGQEAELLQLTALRADLYTELVLQAQAADAAPW